MQAGSARACLWWLTARSSGEEGQIASTLVARVWPPARYGPVPAASQMTGLRSAASGQHSFSLSPAGRGVRRNSVFASTPV